MLEAGAEAEAEPEVDCGFAAAAAEVVWLLATEVEVGGWDGRAMARMFSRRVIRVVVVWVMRAVWCFG